ncbi:hypothetical protein [Pseudarthrobacter sp. AB1]|uniref:hypothetical protein n=1 Tax=Pseudarthrobacter sp. AB1 TaxID=2138309 RepID=UPI00186B77E2|nr:hypothetical protein [Pseudarthrobacter sp. AB1]MBE4720470.1 hypothetical protein [Pseudarthrobacter sp. AB1]
MFALFKSSRRVTAELHTQVPYVTGPSFHVTSAANFVLSLAALGASIMAYRANSKVRNDEGS